MGQKSGYTSAGKTAMDKAQRFLDHVEQFGWQGKITQHEEGVTHCFASRLDDSVKQASQETIDIWWTPPKGAITVAPLYKLAGEIVKLNNVSACISIASKPADYTRLSKAIARSGKARVRKTTAQPLGSTLSVDESAVGTATLGGLIEAASVAVSANLGGSDADVRAALTGRTIEWVNGISGLTHTAYVNSIKKIVRSGTNPNFVEFTDKSGFHAVYLHNIVNVV